MVKIVRLEEMVVMTGLSKERTKFLEECKKIIREATLIAVEENPNFNLRTDEDQYKLIIRTSADLLRDAEVVAGRGCYIEFVSVNRHDAQVVGDRNGLSIEYKGYKFHINYGEKPKKDK